MNRQCGRHARDHRLTIGNISHAAIFLPFLCERRGVNRVALG